MVRILYPYAGTEVTYVKATLEKLYQILEHIKVTNKSGQKLKPQDRFIALDLKQICEGRSCTDNPTWRKALSLLK